MKKEPGEKKKRRLLKIVVLCIITAAAFGLLVFVYNLSSTHTKSYKESEKKIDVIIADQLHKKTNSLTSKDFEKLEDISINLSELTSLKPLLKLKNLKSITFYINPDKNIDLSPLARLKKLKTLEVAIPDRRPTYSKKPRWYEKYLAILRISKPLGSDIRPFDFGQLGKIKRLENLKVHPKFVPLGHAGGLLIKEKELHDLSSIKSLTNLLHLEISQLNVRDYGFIEKLKSLNYLDLSWTEISDIKPLSSLTNLEYLDLTNAKFKDVNTLKKLTGLKNIKLKNVPLRDEQIAELKKALTELKISR